MLVKLFCIYDSKVSTWSSPLPFKHSGDALRWFIERVNSKDNNIGKYPSDFTLFEIGCFNESTGILEQLKAPLSLGIGIEFLSS